MTPMKSRTSSSVSQTSRPRRSSEVGHGQPPAPPVPGRTVSHVGAFQAFEAAGAESEVRERVLPSARAIPVPLLPPHRESRSHCGKSSSLRKVRGSARGPSGARSVTAPRRRRDRGRERRSIGNDGDRRLPQPGGHGRAQAAIGEWRQRRQLRRGVPLIDLGQRVPQSTQSVRLVSFQAPQPWHSVTDRPPGAFRRGASPPVRV